MKYTNPVIKGFNPDPSICVVDEDYYLVNSSFEFYPAVPIYHSKNLVNWELINYCLVDETQIPLGNCRSSHGIFAPTIRYHNGTFYMITTNVSGGGHFFVKTNDIYGKWSQPIWIDAKGIDPSLYFEDDKVYFSSTAITDDKKHAIATSEIELETGKLLSEHKIVSLGTGGTYCEGPHLYKIGKFYYLLTAEGGTSFSHQSCILRGNSPYGPFEPSPYGPMLTHKDRDDIKLHATGHSDMFCDHKGNWWLVSLGIRTIEGASMHNLGRETFLSPVHWTEDGWPIAGDMGKIEFEMEADLPSELETTNNNFYDDFKSSERSLHWTFVRNPNLNNFIFDKGLTILGNEQSLNDFHPNFIGVRQKDFNMSAQTTLQIKNEGYAGISAFYNMSYHYDVYLEKKKNLNYIVLSLTTHEKTNVIKSVKIDSDTAKLKIEADAHKYYFYYHNGNDWILLDWAYVAGICSEGHIFTTFTGTFIGLFSTQTKAKFDYFSIEYKD